MFPILSSAGQRAMLIRSGMPVQPNQPGPNLVQEDTTAPVLDQIVNNPSFDNSSHYTQSETTICVNSNYMVESFNDTTGDSFSGYAVSSDGGKTAFSGYSKAKAALDRKITELRKQDGRKPMPHWVLHDLRRTARSILSRYSTPDIAERVLGHVIPGVRGVYDHHEYADEKREALERLAAHVNDVVHPGQAVMLFSK